MPVGIYTCNKEFTEDQRQMDQIYGIFENLTRTIQFTPQNTFKYTYHYYYQSERNYELVKQLKHDTSFSGTFVQEGQNVIATIINGEHKGGDQITKQEEFTNNITGKITFIVDGNNLKIVSANFDQQFNKRDSASQNLVFKKQP